MTLNGSVDDLVLAHELATMASSIALDLFRRGARARLKADGTPVSEADLAVERCLLAHLERERPHDGILGEEFGTKQVSVSRRRWIVDPVDGTANFLAGNPQWGTNIALEDSGEVVIGVITRPLLGKRWWAKRGQGAYRDGPAVGEAKRLIVSSVAELCESRVTLWAGDDDPRVPGMRQRALWVKPDLDAILSLAEGKLECVVDSSGKPWDHAPAGLIVEEAGGAFSDRYGGRRIDVGEVRYTNGRIHSLLDELLTVS